MLVKLFPIFTRHHLITHTYWTMLIITYIGLVSTLIKVPHHVPYSKRTVVFLSFSTACVSLSFFRTFEKCLNFHWHFLYKPWSTVCLSHHSTNYAHIHYFESKTSPSTSRTFSQTLQLKGSFQRLCRYSRSLLTFHWKRVKIVIRTYASND